MVQTVVSEVYVMQTETITGVIRNALSLNSGAQLQVFRRALAEEIRHRGVRVRQGAPPSRVRLHRERMVRLFCNGTFKDEKRMLLNHLPNGDWDKFEVEIYVPDPLNVCPDSIAETMANGIMSVLAGTKFAVLNRSRWRGADLAIDRVGILEAVHRLGSTSYKRMLQNMNEGYATHADDDEQQSGLLALEDGEQQEIGEAENCETDRTKREKGAKDDPSGGAAFNAQSRRIAYKFWQSKPMGNLIIARLVLEPLRQLMDEKIKVAGEEWERDQWRDLCKALRDGRRPERKYRVTEAANNEGEDRCVRQCLMLLRNRDMWEVMPADSRNVKNRCLVFRMTSRVVGLIKLKLIEPHKLPSTRIFRLLTHPEEISAELKDWCPCRMTR